MAGEEDEPSEKSNNLPVLHPQGNELSVVRPGSKLVSRIAGEAFRHLPSPTKKLWRVGDYEVNEQSYQQIMIWLDQIRASGGDVTLDSFAQAQNRNVELITASIIRRFHEKEGCNLWQDKLALARVRHAAAKAQVTLSRENRSRVYLPYITSRKSGDSSLHLDLNDFIYRDDFDVVYDCSWVIDGIMNAAEFCGYGLKNLYLNYSKNMHFLNFSSNKIVDVDLSQVPNLRIFWCYKNSIKNIDLSHSSNLINLNLHSNHLDDIDLSFTKELQSLNCANNNISKINLSPISKLQELLCHRNRLTALDLSHTPNLTALTCYGNNLEKLDLTHVPHLSWLSCWDNKLTELDIRNCDLKVIKCDPHVIVHKRPEQTVKHPT